VILDDRDTMLWALVCAVYLIEKAPPEGSSGVEKIRKQLDNYDPKKVAELFVEAGLLFSPPRTAEEAKALFDHYGVAHRGLEMLYPARKPQ
jgi:hypothetical protein